MDPRQLAYLLAVNGKLNLARQAHQIIDEERIQTVDDLKILAEDMGIEVSTDMSPYMILDEILSLNQKTKFP